MRSNLDRPLQNEPTAWSPFISASGKRCKFAQFSAGSPCECGRLSPGTGARQRGIEGASSDESTQPPFSRTVAKLVARKQRLLERLKENLGPREREEIERQLEEIDATFVIFRKEASLRILQTCIGLACAATMLMIFHAEKQQEAALDRLSSYELKPQSVLYDDPDVKQVTARSPYMRDER